MGRAREGSSKEEGTENNVSSASRLKETNPERIEVLLSSAEEQMETENFSKTSSPSTISMEMKHGGETSLF